MLVHTLTRTPTSFKDCDFVFTHYKNLWIELVYMLFFLRVVYMLKLARSVCIYVLFSIVLVGAIMLTDFAIGLGQIAAFLLNLVLVYM
jgi:hypothetical protein